MCMSVRPKQPCLPQREVQDSVNFLNDVFLQVKPCYFPSFFCIQVVELGALSRAPQALVVGGPLRPSIHPRIPGWLGLPKRSRASPPPNAIQHPQRPQKPTATPSHLEPGRPPRQLRVIQCLQPLRAPYQNILFPSLLATPPAPGRAPKPDTARGPRLRPLQPRPPF